MTDTGRSRSYTRRLYKISLKGGSRPEVTIPDILDDGRNVLNASILGADLGWRKIGIGIIPPAVCWQGVFWNSHGLFLSTIVLCKLLLESQTTLSFR